MEIILKAENILKTYTSGQVKVEALKKCDVEIKKGEFTAIIGKSGSGKSTLLKILGTFENPDQGRITFEDVDIAGMKDKELSKFRRQKIGFVYQNYSLIPEYTAYENIVLPLILDGKEIDGNEVAELLETLEIEHCENKLPSQMSGGEQQRVAIARALINHPAVIFADEPTGNLDAQSAEKVARMLAMAADKYQQAIVMVTHDHQMAEYADRILSIVDGVVKGGTYES